MASVQHSLELAANFRLRKSAENLHQLTSQSIQPGDRFGSGMHAKLAKGKFK